MAQSPKALVEAAVLEWLRSAAGLSLEVAARRIQTKPEKMESWETGNDQPTMSQLRRLARAYKRPISDFFLPRPMEEPEIPHDFRRLPAEGAQNCSPALRHEIRLAYRRRTLALDLAEELEIKLAKFAGRGSVTDKDDPEKVGERVRTAKMARPEGRLQCMAQKDRRRLTSFAAYSAASVQHMLAQRG
jgi:transcriptional regulator with XRE-family HTH domain